MGAWDTGIFDDDTAYDVLYTLAAAENPRAQIIEWFDTTSDTDYFIYGDCHCMLVSGAMIDAALNGTEIPNTIGSMYTDVLEQLKQDDLTELRPIAVVRLEKVLNGPSELKELWSENKELYPVWRASVQGIIDRLR